MKLVGRTGEALERIVARVDDISTRIAQIATAAREQSNGIQQVNGAVVDMDKVTQQNAAMVEESSAAARSLAHEADALSGLMAQFQLDQPTGRRSEATPRAMQSVDAPRKRPLTHGNLAVAVQEDWAEF